MSETEEYNTRSMDESGALEDSEQLTGGGRSSYGPPISVGGEQDPGDVAPPYDDRQQESKPVDEGGVVRDGAYVGGATGPRTVDEGLTSPAPDDTPGGRVASPSDEMPAESTGGPNPQPGVGPAHTTGTPRGEDRGA